MPLRKTALALAFLAGTAFSAFAGDQYVDSSGYAVSGYDVVAYFDLEQNPVGSSQPQAVRGSKAFTADYNGAKWAFSSAENRDKFLADPAKYSPQFDGHCAFGAAKGGKVPGNPHLWRIVDGKLYLNITENVVSFWEEDIPGFISTGDGNWRNGLEGQDASASEIRNMTARSARPADCTAQYDQGLRLTPGAFLDKPSFDTEAAPLDLTAETCFPRCGDSRKRPPFAHQCPAVQGL